MADVSPPTAPVESTPAQPIEPSVPSTTPNAAPEAQANGSATATLQNAKDKVVSTAQSAVASVQNNQAIKDIANVSGSLDSISLPINDQLGPVAQNVKDQASKTSSEVQALAGSRTVPEKPAATGQELTQYHSLFYRLLTWEQPRATAIAFAGTILLILGARYFNVLKYVFKFTYFVLGVTASIEVAGKLLFDDGLATKMRPKKYWTIPKESLERSLEDVEQLLNFFVIEAQRIVWAENVYATIAVFASALVSYWLIKLLPIWGLSLVATCVLFLTPLIYQKNRETIDSGLEHVTNVIGTQAEQIKNITAEQTGKATESIKSYTNEYTAKAQEYIGSRRSSGPTATHPSVNGTDFPEAPKEEPVNPSSATVPSPAETEPLLSH